MAAVARPAGQPAQSYTFAAEPRPVVPWGQRPKYRNRPAEDMGPMNIMYDPRVIRGNTWAANILPAVRSPVGYV